MKLLSLIAVSFVACLAFSLPAHAATIELSTSADPTSSSDTYTTRTVSTTGGVTWDNIVGYLAPHTSITITYSGTDVYKMILNASGLDENVNWIVSSASSKNDSSGFIITSSQTSTSTTVPLILATANLSLQSGKVVITNNSDSVISFNSDFGISFVDNGSGTYTVSYSVSAVPLPAAGFLFFSGLMGFAGFAKRKKA